MFFPSSMSPMRHVCFLLAALHFAGNSAHAQSQPTLNLPGASSVSSNESSSASLPLAVDDSPSSNSALPLVPAGGASGSGPMGSAAKAGLFSLSHLAVEAGAGFNTPIGNDGNVLTWGGNINLGGGLHFSKRFTLLAEYNFTDDKLPGSLIADAGAQGGYAHIWSLTLDPVIDLFPKRTNSAYVTGGGGFYRKVTSFTDPVEVEECYYFCGIGYENEVVSHFSSNQGGVNFGAGLTHRLGGVYGDGQMRLFGEVRYVYLSTPPVGQRNGLGSTEMLPVTFGVRW
jgi:hypothetical protein